MIAPTIEYLSGFGNFFETESLPGALPLQQNSPQKPAYGLYPEQLSGSCFTMPRSQNLRSWLYRIRPSVAEANYTPYHLNNFSGKNIANASANPNQMRWSSLDYPGTDTNFLQGLQSWATNSLGSIHLFAINISMENEFFCNTDGELLIVLQEGNLSAITEFGLLEIQPGEILVIPRGVKFQITLNSQHARGYVLENYSTPLTLPDLGLIGANGLANPRDFLAPTANYFDRSDNYRIITKFSESLWETNLSYHPLDVVAWHGNYYPYKYDLRKFNTINTVSFDHPDPSIFTVLTSQSHKPGLANIDFVIFPERWMVAEHSFRAPYYHRNLMSEFMGMIYGVYDAKPDGFNPGSCSLHNRMIPHGPDAKAFTYATDTKLEPEYLADTLAFMFESQEIWRISKLASETNKQNDYQKCWNDLPIKFNPGKK